LLLIGYVEGIDSERGIAKFRRKPAELSVKEASDLIQELSNLTRASAT
jgi:hypothetical protein